MEEFVFKIAYCCELIISINFAILTMTNTMIGDTISWYQSPISSLKLCCGICFIMPCCLLVAPVSRVGLWFLQGQSLVFFQLMLIEGVSLYHLHQVHSVLYSEYHFNCSLYPPLQRSWKGGILVSPCPSVRLWTESCPLCIFNNTHRIHFIFAHLIKQLQKVCRV